MHSLESLSFLKIDPYNYLSFRCQDYNNRVISIEQEWIKTTDNPDENEKMDSQNLYDDLYKVKIHEITLRELLILQSIYVTETGTQKYELLKM
jgi:hypothetical protein